jgi:hypothetical protein
MEYELQRCTRHCATTGRELRPGETYYTALVGGGRDLQRRDFAAEAWQGPPEGAIGWWKSKIPEPTARKPQIAPNDVLLQLFDELENQPRRADMRYVLALLLVRRRVARPEESEHDADGNELMVLYCPRREATLKTPIVMPTSARAAEIQEQLCALLYTGGEKPPSPLPATN